MPNDVEHPQKDRWKDGGRRIPPGRLAVAEAAEEEEAFRSAASFIRPLEDLDPAERIAGLWRSTHPGSQSHDSKSGQQETIREAVREAGGRVEVWFGKAGVAGYSEMWLRCLATVFRRTGERGIKQLMISEPSRIARSEGFGNHNPYARPTPEFLRRVGRLAEMQSVTVFSVCSPDAPFSKERGFQTKRSRRNGRPQGTRNRKAGWCKERAERFTAVGAGGGGRREVAEGGGDDRYRRSKGGGMLCPADQLRDG